MKLVMTILVRDEIDIIGRNLSFHLASGVDHVIAIDNGSIDGTRDLLADFERRGSVTVIDEPKQDFSQSKWMTNAAFMARDDFGADWILNNDADEFWVSREGSIKDQLRKTKADALLCPRMNMVFPWDDDRDEPWVTKCTNRVQSPTVIPNITNRLVDPLPCPYFFLALPGKVLVRTRNLTKVAMGNHMADFNRDAVVEPGEIDIFHFPLRSRNQFRSKIVNGGEAYNRNKVLSVSIGWHWRRWYRLLQTQGIDAALADALPCKEALERNLADGTAVEDRRMIAYLDPKGV